MGPPSFKTTVIQLQSPPTGDAVKGEISGQSRPSAHQTPPRSGGGGMCQRDMRQKPA